MGRQPCPGNLGSYSGGSAECVVDAGVKSIIVGRKSRHRYLLSVPLECRLYPMFYVLCLHDGFARWALIDQVENMIGE